MLSDRCLSVLFVCNVRALCLWPNGWTDHDETWHAGRPRPWPHCVRWGPSSPSSKGHSTSPPSPIFDPYLVRPNGCMDQDVTWYRTRPRLRRLSVRWGLRSAFPKRGGRSPQIFGPCLLWPNGSMDEAGTWHQGLMRRVAHPAHFDLPGLYRVSRSLVYSYSA